MTNKDFEVKPTDQPFQPITITIKNRQALEILTELTNRVVSQVPNEVQVSMSNLNDVLKKFCPDRKPAQYFKGAIYSDTGFDIGF